MLAAPGVAAAVAVVLQLLPGTPSPSSVDRPTGHQRPLVASLVAHDPGGGPTFSIMLPTPPQSGSEDPQPAADGSVDFGGVRLGGSTFGALLLVKGGDGWSTSPRTSLEHEAASGVPGQLLVPVGPIRRTVVGTTQAYAREFVLTNGVHLREFRFAHDRYIYGAGIMYRPTDTVSLDTGLAALHTWRWIN